MSKKKNKKKKTKAPKEKVIYVDDNSTVVDMSGTQAPKKSKSTFKEKARTYFSTVKKMIVPMLITLLAFTLVYVLLLLATGRF